MYYTYVLLSEQDGKFYVGYNWLRFFMVPTHCVGTGIRTLCVPWYAAGITGPVAAIRNVRRIPRFCPLASGKEPCPQGD